MPEPLPPRAVRRNFIRSELKRLRPIYQARKQPRLTFKSLWRFSLTTPPR